MNALMYLKRLEDFTSRIALKVLNHYIKSPNIKIRKGQLNLIKNGICDSQMKKYVVSIGDALYQIVEKRALNEMKRASLPATQHNIQASKARAEGMKLTQELRHKDAMLNATQNMLRDTSKLNPSVKKHSIF